MKRIPSSKLPLYQNELFPAITALVSGVTCGLLAIRFGLVPSLSAAVLITALLTVFLNVKAIARSKIKEGSGSKNIETISPDRIDSVTGLANQNGLLAWFAEKADVTKDETKGIIVVTADLHGFEELYQKRGKVLSDAVLVELAKRVSSCVPTEGIAARIEGGEFAAIASVVPNAFEEFAAEQAGRLAELIQRPVELPSGVIWVGGSVGAAYGPVSEGNAIFASAKNALQSAKKLGLGHYVVNKSI